jgi:hypothetical protein
MCHRVQRAAQVAEEGLELPPKTPGKSGNSETGDVESSAIPARLRHLADRLRMRLSTNECHRLAALLTTKNVEENA